MNLLLTIEYDGAAFCGWQKQPLARTVQSEIEKASSRIFKTPSIVSTAAGRTDKGVHALAQSVALAVTGGRSYPLKKILLAFNAVLPADIAITAVKRIPAAFNPRFKARAKQYEYAIWNSPCRSVWRQKYAWQVPRPLDVPAMRRAARYCIGKHDFNAFYASGGTQENTMVTLTKIRITTATPAGAIIILFQADRFLYKMVRTLVGTLVEVGLGKRPPASLRDILSSRNRRLAGETAPPEGLFLKKIMY
ncbi:MAG: tRNA pseudouridine(38-40) synthase TruA [Elusimicrobiota bacterium]